MSAVTIALSAENLADTYWGKIIEESELQGFFSDEAKGLANDWTTCACGKQSSRLVDKDTPYGRGEPWDKELLRFGTEFANAVDYEEFMVAAEKLIQIEHRASFLLSSMGDT